MHPYRTPAEKELEGPRPVYPDNPVLVIVFVSLVYMLFHFVVSLLAYVAGI